MSLNAINANAPAAFTPATPTDSAPAATTGSALKTKKVRRHAKTQGAPPANTPTSFNANAAAGQPAATVSISAAARAAVAQTTPNTPQAPTAPGGNASSNR